MSKKKDKELPKDSATNSHKDLFLWSIAVALAVVSLVLFYQYDTQPLAVRIVVILTGFGIAAFVASRTAKGTQILSFLVETRREVRLVVWPTRAETIQVTLIVFVAVTIVGLFLWGVDSFFLWAVKMLTGQI